MEGLLFTWAAFQSARKSFTCNTSVWITDLRWVAQLMIKLWRPQSSQCKPRPCAKSKGHSAPREPLRQLCTGEILTPVTLNTQFKKFTIYWGINPLRLVLCFAFVRYHLRGKRSPEEQVGWGVPGPLLGTYSWPAICLREPGTDNRYWHNPAV